MVVVVGCGRVWRYRRGVGGCGGCGVMVWCVEWWLRCGGLRVGGVCVRVGW